MEYLTTTAISYPNGKPHIGHMYEAILADIIRNIYLIKGHDSKFLTGTDEHGKKIQQTAEREGISPKELCDINVEHFKELMSKLQIKADRFIRTTDQDHEDLVKEMIISSSRFMTKEKYVGYYNIREESYVSEHEASETDFKDPVTNIPYEKKEEESYKFDLPRFVDIIRSQIDKVVGFNMESFESRLQDLQKLTVSRLKSDFTWGIDFPLDPDHIVYVWYDLDDKALNR